MDETAALAMNIKLSVETNSIKLLFRARDGKKQSMANWKDDAFKKVRERRKKERADLDNVFKKNEMLRDAAVELWDNLCSIVEQDVNDFNQTFSDDKAIHLDFSRDDSYRFTIKRINYAPMNLQAVYQEKGTPVVVLLELPNRETKKDVLHLDMDTQGIVYFKYHDNRMALDDLSGILLKPFMDE